jgi:hypothetical protein
MSVMVTTFATFHLEMSVLKASVSANTTPPETYREQWTRKGGEQEIMQTNKNSKVN